MKKLTKTTVVLGGMAIFAGAFATQAAAYMPGAPAPQVDPIVQSDQRPKNTFIPAPGDPGTRNVNVNGQVGFGFGNGGN